MIKITSAGSTKNLDAFLDRILKGHISTNLHAHAKRGVAALQSATPRDSGLTAASWTYEIIDDGSQVTIWWSNTNQVNGFHVAIGLQYGHGTGTGGWVEGHDFINPALKPIFDEIADAVWKEVQSA